MGQLLTLKEYRAKVGCKAKLKDSGFSNDTRLKILAGTGKIEYYRAKPILSRIADALFIPALFVALFFMLRLT